MQITGKLGVQFFNLGHDRNLDDELDASEYQRVNRCWNIYYHGFMDRYDDIAYVKVPTNIEPGIYEVVTYGIPAILFVWMYCNDHTRDLKGLIVKVGDDELMEDALAKYNARKEFI